MDYNRENIKGNLLKQVVTRIDYQDIFSLSPETMKEIGLICAEHGLIQKGYRVLDESDIQTNDIVSSISIPYEYLKDINSIVFYNDDKSFLVEINQLYIKVTQLVDSTYKRYHETIKLLKPILESLFELEKRVDVKRISIKKSNQVIFKEIESFLKYFKEDILRFNIFNMGIIWNGQDSQSTLIQNFSVKDVYVNFLRIFDNGEFKENKCSRLYLEYETYLKETHHSLIINELKRINEIIFELFKNSLTEYALDSLVNDERIGDFE